VAGGHIDFQMRYRFLFVICHIVPSLSLQTKNPSSRHTLDHAKPHMSINYWKSCQFRKNQGTPLAPFSIELRAVLHEPIVCKAAVAHRIGDVGIPEEFLDDSRLPCHGSVSPAVNERNALVENFEVGTPKCDVPFG